MKWGLLLGFVLGVGAGYAAGRLPADRKEPMPRYVVGAAARPVPDRALPPSPGPVEEAMVPVLVPGSVPESDQAPEHAPEQDALQAVESPAESAPAQPEELQAGDGGRAVPPPSRGPGRPGRGGRFARGNRGGRTDLDVPEQVVPGREAALPAVTAVVEPEPEVDTQPVGPFRIPESELRLARDAIKRYEALRRERMKPVMEQFERSQEQAKEIARQLNAELERDLRAALGDQAMDRYLFERDQTGRLDEALSALDRMDQGFLGIQFDAEPIAEGALGIRILEVVPGSAADYAGVRAGEVIVGIGDQAIAGWREFRAAIRGNQPGTPLLMRLYDLESKTTREVSVVLGDAGRDALRRLYEDDGSGR